MLDDVYKAFSCALTSELGWKGLHVSIPTLHTYMFSEFLQGTVWLKSAVAFNNRNMFKSSGTSMEWKQLLRGNYLYSEMFSILCAVASTVKVLITLNIKRNHTL